MKIHHATSITNATVVGFGLLLGLSACSDDNEPTTLAKGSDVEFVGDDNLGASTLNLIAVNDDGEVSGEMRFSDGTSDLVVKVECADTETGGVVILGGTITEAQSMSGLLALFIKEGDPDRASVWFDDGENQSCTDFLEDRHDVIDMESEFVEVEPGSNIETG